MEDLHGKKKYTLADVLSSRGTSFWFSNQPYEPKTSAFELKKSLKIKMNIQFSQSKSKDSDKDHGARALLIQAESANLGPSTTFL